jgi:hypothetical protein
MKEIRFSKVRMMAEQELHRHDISDENRSSMERSSL